MNVDLTLEQLYQATHYLFVAHAMTVKLGHEIDPAMKVGCMLSLSHIATYPYTCDPDDILGVVDHRRKHYLFLDVMCKGFYPGYVKRIWRDNGINLDMSEDELALIKENTSDYIAFSYYRSTVFHKDAEVRVDTGGSAGLNNPYLKETSPEPWSWPVDPKGLRFVCNDLNDRYGLPLFIVENGIGLDESPNADDKISDEFRKRYIHDHLVQVQESIEDGCEIMGYLYWGPIDIVSAGTGEMKKRYGFVYVDRDNEGKGSFRRLKKDSFDYFRQIILSNGENLDY